MDPVRQVPLAQVKPDPFHGIQFRRVGWQPEQRQIGWDNEIQAGMPPGAVKHHHGMLVGGQSCRKTLQELAHRRGGHPWQHQTEIAAGGRFDRGEGVDERVALVDASARPIPAQPPAMTGLTLLAKAGLILEKQRDPIARMRLGGGRQSFGERLKLGRLGIRIGVRMAGADFLPRETQLAQDPAQA
jgi:hypothetical protein